MTAYNFSSRRSHLCANLTTAVAPFPIAFFSHTPYLVRRLTVLTPSYPPFSLPAADFPPFSDLDAAEDADALRDSLGPDEMRSLRLKRPFSVPGVGGMTASSGGEMGLDESCCAERPGRAPPLLLRLTWLSLSARCDGWTALGSAVVALELPLRRKEVVREGDRDVAMDGGPEGE